MSVHPTYFNLATSLGLNSKNCCKDHCSGGEIMTRKRKCHSKSNSFVAAAEQICLQPVLEHRQRRGRRSIAWQAIPHLCSSNRKGKTSDSWPTTGRNIKLFSGGGPEPASTWLQSVIAKVRYTQTKVMAALRRVYDSRHQQADCQEPGSAVEPYARQSSMGFTFCTVVTDRHTHTEKQTTWRRYFVCLFVCLSVSVSVSVCYVVDE